MGQRESDHFNGHEEAEAVPRGEVIAPNKAEADVPELPPERKPSVLDTYREVGKEFWSYQDLLYQLVRRDIRIRYKQAAMGFAWALLMPLVIVLAGIVVRYAMARLSGTSLEVDHISGMAVKALGWAFFVGGITFSANSLVGNMVLVGKVYFPRELLPISAILAQTFDSTIGALALFVALPLLGVSYSWSVLWVLPLGAMLFLFTAALALILSCGNLFFRDVKYLVQVGVTFGIFFTPVFFEPVMFGATGGEVMMLNPLSPVLEGLRLAVVEGHNLLVPFTESLESGGTWTWTPWYLVYGLAVSLVTLLGGTLLFHRLEFVFAEYV